MKLKKQSMKVVDLFAGCGGLSYGFLREGAKILAHLELDKSCCETLRINFEDQDNRIFQLDIRDTKSYLNNKKNSLLKLVKKEGNLDIILGGPPCQAYSVAGRIRDPKGMRDDYRNYLFEAFIENLKILKPKVFLFENVVGMLSAKPQGEPITDLIGSEFQKAGFSILGNLKDCVINMADFGIPQNPGISKGRNFLRV